MNFSPDMQELADLLVKVCVRELNARGGQKDARADASRERAKDDEHAHCKPPAQPERR
jgi:hypothetical protein